MNSNILITSAGKRVVLTQIFQKSLSLRELDAKVFTTDLNPQLCPAGYISDGCFEVPRCTDTTYIPTLLSLCKKHAIGIIIPTIDTELEVLAAHRTEFLEQGTTVVVSDLTFIQQCRDKRKTHQLFDELDINVPKAIDKHQPTFPLFAKPYDGSLSCNTHIITSASQLTEEIMSDKKLMFMEYIDKSSYAEFTVDIYFGKDEEVKCIVPRERLAIRAGEINKGITRKNSIVKYLKQRMNKLTGVRGCICVQLFYEPHTEKIYGIEINPRFGGGYPLSYHAGANFPLHIIDEYLLDKSLNYNESWHNNTLMLRYDNEIIVPHCDSL